MNAKEKFREGWIMLRRPFQFAEHSRPLQNLTIVYAYSEKPIITMELDAQGREEMELMSQAGKSSFLGRNKYSRHFGESDCGWI